jgi:integrase
MRSKTLLNDSLRDLVGDYLEAVKVGRHTTSKRKKTIPRSATVALYRTILLDVFMPWADSVGLTDPAEITEDALDKFTEYLQTKPGKNNGRPLSVTTIQSYGRDVNTFLKWAHSQGGVADVHMTTETPPDQEFDLLTRTEIDAMVKTAGSLRDKLIVRILSDTGCRLGELLSLTIGDVVKEDGRHFLNFRGKTGHRTAGIERELYRDLITYIKARPGSDEHKAMVFMSERKSAKNGYAPLTTSGVQQMLTHLGEDAKVEKRVYAHLLRHGYATEFLRGHGDPVTLARVLGHKNLTMIQRVYTHLNDQDVQAAMLAHLGRVRQS